MSESPDSERSSEGRSSPNEKLQIRLVPYQPPRLSGGSELFNPNASIGSNLDNVEIHSADYSPATASPPSSASTIAGPSRASAGKRRSSSIGPNEILDTGSSAIEAAPRGRYRSQSLSQSLKTLTSPPSPELPPDAAANIAAATAAAAATSPVQRRPKRFIDINLNSDNKTFSLVPLNSVRASRTNSVVSTRTDSNPHYSVASSSSYMQNSSSIFSEDRPSSALTTLAEDSASVTASSLGPSIPEEDDDSMSPWNYNLVGGLRKVQSQLSDATETTPTQLPPFLEEDPVASGKIAVEEERIAAFTLNSKKSFQSNKTGNTVSDRTNYKTYAQSSSGPDTVRGSMASDFDTSSLFPGGPNYVVYDGASTSDQSRAHSDSEVRETPNYVVHGHRRTQSDGTDISHAPSEYSNNSMVVAPLRPMRSGRLYSSSTIPSTRSLEHLRTGSLTSVSSSRLNREAESNAPAGMSTQVDLEGRHSRSQSSASQVHRRNTSRTQPWGTALSTVMSESERSDPSTRSISRLSGNARSSVFTLNQLRQTGSFSTFGLEETLAMASHSRNGSVDRPQPVYGRDTPFSTARLVRDHDEDGDGLADLESMNRLPSRARGLSMASEHSGPRNHRSRSRSNSRNNSISYTSVIPAWARVYYGSGERRFLAAQPSNESMFSQFTSSLHRDSSHSRSPSYEAYTGEIINPRRRPREMHRRASESDSMDIRPNPYMPVDHSVKKQTSSVWSPHLQTDRRASRFSIWSPPSLAESADYGIWKRNLQLVLFVLGFICPFSAILPIPPKLEREMTEQAYSTGHLDIRMEARQQRLYINAERLHERARWWRSVNRRMSIIGALIICLCVVLIAVGVTQWHS
ncbi:uncharacterized protein Triagg1_660 [Trichoderma aggressivum f. europaeum]|uniref:Serine-rich protein n=1 Tax=Trichoderma aggressivum f. europaeum TaxID=173218 RepID=A0AAE1JJA6_9HYPO|nr:hypothetical protein Triagg1_660 [Trichoderma aggressivum f. europaeum]